MRSRRGRIIAAIVVAPVVLGLWVLFAPTQLAGSTTYSITSGISMQPLLYKNDLALVRAQSSYHVGNVVLYQSQVLHRPVLHRIILIQNGNYFFKGDNNGFVDPGYATQSELVGKLWLHTPEAGAVLGWFGKPLHAALLAGLAAMVLVLTGFTAPQPRSRRRRGTTTHKGRVMRPMVNRELATRSPGSRSPDRGSVAAMTSQQLAAGGETPPLMNGDLGSQ